MRGRLSPAPGQPQERRQPGSCPAPSGTCNMPCSSCSDAVSRWFSACSSDMASGWPRSSGSRWGGADTCFRSRLHSSSRLVTLHFSWSTCSPGEKHSPAHAALHLCLGGRGKQREDAGQKTSLEARKVMAGQPQEGRTILLLGQSYHSCTQKLFPAGQRRKMQLRKRVQSQDPLSAQQLSCYLAASPVQLVLTPSRPGTSGALPKPAAVSIPKASQLLEQPRNKLTAEKSTGGHSVWGGHFWPGKRLRLKLLEVAGTTDASSHPGLLSHSSTTVSLEQGRSVTFRSKGGPHRPVTTNEVDQRTRVSQPGKALR